MQKLGYKITTFVLILSFLRERVLKLSRFDSADDGVEALEQVTRSEYMLQGGYRLDCIL